MTAVEDRGTYVIKDELPAFPEAEQYQALNAVDAPVVKLLDVIQDGCQRRLVLEKAAPLSFDPATEQGFKRILDWVGLFNSADVPYPPCNMRYLEQFWVWSSDLLDQATDPGSMLHRETFRELPSAESIFEEFRTLVAAGPVTVSHGDPANSNLGEVDGRLVAFDLGLSWMNSPFVDLVLRTGAQVTPFPRTVEVRDLVASYADRLGVASGNPLKSYAICGAVYGTYFEESAVLAIRNGTASEAEREWATLALDRFEKFAALLMEA